MFDNWNRVFNVDSDGNRIAFQMARIRNACTEQYEGNAEFSINDWYSWFFSSNDNGRRLFTQTFSVLTFDPYFIWFQSQNASFI